MTMIITPNLDLSYLANMQYTTKKIEIKMPNGVW